MSCSSLSVSCLEAVYARHLPPDSVTGSLRILFCWVCTLAKYSYFSGLRPSSVLVFLPLSLTLTVLPLPALNKDNYSGNISTNQTQPCILPVRGATSQDLANIAGAWSPCLKSGAFPGWGLRVSSMFYKCWHNTVSGSHASTEVSSVFFSISTLW